MILKKKSVLLRPYIVSRISLKFWKEWKEGSELSTLAICMINTNKEVIAFMALCDHPNVLGLEPSDWEVWIRNLYQRFYLARNTLFIHFMCCADEVTDFFLDEAFVSVFLNDSYLLHIVLVVPLYCNEDEHIKRFLTFKKRNIRRYAPKSDDGNGNSLYTALRREFCPKLKMRRAVEEDNDDIVEILDSKCPRIKEIYGEYYISEIIGRYPESKRKIIAADCGGRAVGVMGLNTAINYRNLQKTYELRTFYGLRRATALEREQSRRANVLLTDFGEPIMQGKWNPFINPLKSAAMHDDETPRKDTGYKRTKKMSKVSFRRNAAMRKSLDQIIFKKQHSDDYSDIYPQSRSPSQVTVGSFINLLDEDPFDYEIINIDKSLLTVPDALSCELVCKPSYNKSKDSQIGLCSFNRRKSKKCIFWFSFFCGMVYNMGTNVLNGEVKLQKKSQLKTDKREDAEPTIYAGGRNAFIIELFGLRDDIDQRYGFDLLEAAFEITKDYDYCVIRVPSAQKPFPLLQHFCYVPMRPNVCCKYALYLAHRSSVLGKLRVRPAEFIDIPNVARLFQNLDGRETLWSVESSIDKKQNQAYVFASGASIVGLGILEPPEQIDFIRSRFNLDSFHIHKYYYRGQGVDAGFSALKAVLVYPVFEPHFRFFVREMMRLSGTNALMWLTAYRNKWCVRKANCLLSAMVPLVPRPLAIDINAAPELKKISTLMNNIMAFSTWFCSKKITSIPKVNVCTRIVIVGASRTALGFLNALLFSDSSTYLTFTSVTVVSPNGLPYARRTNAVAELMFPRHYTGSNKYMKSVPYTYYVNIIQGTMVEIDQQEKYIALTSGGKYYYDLLFLFFGKQYQHPNYMSHLLEKEKDYQEGRTTHYIRLDTPTYSDTELQITSDETPDNVFIINDISEAIRAVDYVKQSAWQTNVVVYGATVHTYCCIHALMEMKVPPDNIVLVEPFPHENPKKLRVPAFNNEYVDQTVREVLDNLHVKVYRSYYFQSWTLGLDNKVTHVDFLSQFHMLHLECSALFYYGTRGVNTQAFLAINKSRLIYDGGLVIDLECRTSDRSIYAAGPATSYHKRYFVSSNRHKYYDSYEVGEKLGDRIRNKLDPLFTEKVSSTSNASDFLRNTKCCASDINTGAEEESSLSLARLLQLKKPKVLYCTLPGGLNYLEVRAPGFKIPHHYVQSFQYNGIVMETYKGGYFKLHLTKDLVVDRVTCLNTEKFSLENFKNLYGQPASVLNNVYLRYMTKKLDDFYEFFRSPWAHFLYHDQVDDLFAMVKELLPKGHPKGHTLQEALCKFGKNLSDPSLKFNTKMRVRANFENSAYAEAVMDYVIDWLSKNDVLLPMYLQPSQTVYYTHDLLYNPRYIKRKNSITKMVLKLL